MVAYQSAPGLNRNLSSTLLWLRTAKCEIYRRKYGEYGEAFFRKK